MPKCHGVVIEEASIDELQEYLSHGNLTSQQLAMCYLQRIWQTDDYINAVLEINPDFLELALDRMETTAGSWALLSSVVPRDAHVVAKLRAAGALLTGKATLSEWADMRSNNYSEGYSARGGQCRSAYNLTVSPGGSSSGSAVGVAANVFPFALGTETDGSIINPAGRNSIVGFKPTVGLTSRAGVVPESAHQDSVGCFGKSVRDVTYVLDAIYGPDERDNYTLAQVGHTPSEGYAQYLTNKTTLCNAIFGIPWSSFWVYASDEQLEVLLSMIALIESAGATIVNNTELLDYETIVSPDGWNWDYGTTLKVDFYNNIKSYLADLNNTHIRSLEDIVEYNYANDGSEGGNPWPLGNPAFYSGQDGFLASTETKGVMNETYCPGGKQLDALLVPPDVGQSYQIAAQAGYPMITIPAGISSATGMPYGLALMQTTWREDALVRWASAIEDLMASTPYKRTPPKWFGYQERNIPVRNL
ncbi:Putative amidase [Fulvia fulva]|uniref:Amidase n=1 Tax=Passalora fulva TaxID=5499 RepID=A0A9Q8L9S0_PASFU|nr:Putative amidase [Fulvia fulva]KAK4631332.1 putative amidase [Fulvia fulva]KAK4632760.1 putative amidase [Fulvia fulva]UJO13405.1 Putative amidase [Fulvia fulva]WPV11902.1 Putative amidase [Fulvia fulva]WPV25698.1 Putative amidase [Fulvia fulva]